jgi:FdhD protein
MPQKNDRAIQKLAASRLRSGELLPCEDCVVVEEPLEIRLSGRRFTATMRTPGDDELLARGLLFSEGVIRDNDDIEELSVKTLCRERSGELVNLVDVTLHDIASIPAQLWERTLISNASCGLCGKSSIEALRTRVLPLPNHAPVSVSQLLRLPQLLRAKQKWFDETGGLHAAGIFRVHENDVETLAVFEDIGRHNATDKAIGFGLQNHWLPPRAEPGVLVLLVSGRASFEIVQKALVARIPIVCAVSAVSSLAVELSRANNQTLVGFTREETLTVYSGFENVKPNAPA